MCCFEFAVIGKHGFLILDGALNQSIAPGIPEGNITKYVNDHGDHNKEYNATTNDLQDLLSDVSLEILCLKRFEFTERRCSRTFKDHAAQVKEEQDAHANPSVNASPFAGDAKPHRQSTEPKRQKQLF